MHFCSVEHEKPFRASLFIWDKYLFFFFFLVYKGMQQQQLHPAVSTPAQKERKNYNGTGHTRSHTWGHGDRLPPPRVRNALRHFGSTGFVVEESIRRGICSPLYNPCFSFSNNWRDRDLSNVIPIWFRRVASARSGRPTSFFSLKSGASPWYQNSPLNCEKETDK